MHTSQVHFEISPANEPCHISAIHCNTLQHTATTPANEPCSSRNSRDQARCENVFHLRWGGVFLERTRNLSGIQCTRQFIEFVVEETKRFVNSNVNVILTRQPCGQRSSMSAGSKRRALQNHFPERFATCPNTRMITRLRSMSMHFLCKCVWRTAAQCQIPKNSAAKGVFRGNRHCTEVLCTPVPKKCIDLDLTLLYNLTLGTCSKFVQENDFAALGVCFPQTCSSVGRRFVASRSRSHYY